MSPSRFDRAGDMAEYMLVSAPGEPTPKKTWDLINERTSSLAINNKFSIPDLKVSGHSWEGLNLLSLDPLGASEAVIALVACT